MANSTIPVRVPERQPEPAESTARHPAAWREKKPSRFAIKVGGMIPA